MLFNLEMNLHTLEVPNKRLLLPVPFINFGLFSIPSVIHFFVFDAVNVRFFTTPFILTPLVYSVPPRISILFISLIHFIVSYFFLLYDTNCLRLNHIYLIYLSLRFFLICSYFWPNLTLNVLINMIL